MLYGGPTCKSTCIYMCVLGRSLDLICDRQGLCTYPGLKVVVLYKYITCNNWMMASMLVLYAVTSCNVHIVVHIVHGQVSVDLEN